MQKCKIMERLRRKEVPLKGVKRLPHSYIGENDCSVEFFTTPLQGIINLIPFHEIQQLLHGNTFGKVARLINISPLENSNVIGQ